MVEARGQVKLSAGKQSHANNFGTKNKPNQKVHSIATQPGLPKYSRIVLSTHGHTGLNRLLMGSTTEQVVRHAECPVRVVRKRDS